MPTGIPLTATSPALASVKRDARGPHRRARARIPRSSPAPPAPPTAPQGIDVSHWQGAIDWLGSAPAATTFAFAKATEGTAYTDPTYAIEPGRRGRRPGCGSARTTSRGRRARPTRRRSRARSRRRTTSSPSRSRGAATCRPVLDLETTGGLGHALTIWTQAWLDQVERAPGVTPADLRVAELLEDVARRHAARSPRPATGSGSRTGRRRRSRSCPPANWGGLGWTFWQWTTARRCPGIPAAWTATAVNGASAGGRGDRRRRAAGPPASSEPPAVVGTPQAGRLLVATAGRWTGGKPALVHATSGSAATRPAPAACRSRARPASPTRRSQPTPAMRSSSA